MFLETASLEAVAAILLATAVAGGLVFFCRLEEIAKRSGAAWLVGIQSDIFWC